jgi:ribokinase
VLPHHGEGTWWQATQRLAPAPPLRETRIRLFTAMPSDVLARQLDACSSRVQTIADTSTGYAQAETEALLKQVSRLSCFAPSREETRILFPGMDDDDALQELSRRVPLALQKRGADGVVLRRGDAVLVESPQAGDVVETTGAGDSLVGAVAAGLALCLDDAELLRRGALTAALTIAGIGASRLISGVLTSTVGKVETIIQSEKAP